MKYLSEGPVYELGWELNEGSLVLLDILLSDMEKAGVDVMIIMAPYQHLVYKNLQTMPAYKSVLPEFRKGLERVAKHNPRISICDALDPLKSHCSETEFMDGMHALESCERKVIFNCFQSALPWSSLLVKTERVD